MLTIADYPILRAITRDGRLPDRAQLDLLLQAFRQTVGKEHADARDSTADAS